MRRWIFNLTCAASLLLFISISALWIRSYQVWDELWWGTCKPEWNFIRSVPGWVRIDHYGFWRAGWWAEQVTVKPRLYERPAGEWQYDYSPGLELSRRGPSARTDYVLHGTLPHWLIALPFAGLPLWWTWRRVAGKSRWYAEPAGVSCVVLTVLCVVSFWWHITFDVDTGRSYNVVAIDRAALRLRQVDISIGLGQSIGFGASPSGSPQSRGTTDYPYRTIMPLWLVAAALAFPVALAVRERRARARNPALCADCGYDLRATPERCPECGRVPPSAIRTA